MLSNYFANYEEFNALFGKKENGQRKNKIFLAAYKYACKTKRRELFEKNNSRIDLDELVRKIFYPYRNDSGLSKLNGFEFASNKYKLDDRKGLCDDGDINSIRYVNLENGRVFKMKAGKFIRAILQENGMITQHGEVLCNYFCEQFAEQWKKMNDSANFKLNVDRDFSFIYDSDNCVDDSTFGSCMTDKSQYGFYQNAVEALAASLLNNDGEIVARCIIFTNVANETNNTVLRLAERQYAHQDLHKQILIDKLIAENRIDGYKKTGAGCGDSRKFVLNNGESLRDCKLSISCELNSDSEISYQDSFKYFDMDEQRAYNYSSSNYTHQLDTTDEYLEGRNWDEYNEEYTSDELTTVYVWCSHQYRYNEMSCSNGYADDNLYWINELNGYADEYYYSDLLEERLPMDKWEGLEDEWKSDNWEWDELNEEYVELTEMCHIWNEETEEYEQMQVCFQMAKSTFFEINGEYYDKVCDCVQPLSGVVCECMNEIAA